MADFYDGETYDATISLDKANWRSAVQERLRVKPKLMADYGADVKEHETFAPVSCKKLGNALIYDFGQNFAGVVRLTVTGKRGQKITIRHSEVLNPDGTLNTAFLRTAKATATYICKDGKQTWSPRLTYMGFRYISVEGVREEDVQVTGVMLYSDIQQTGSFRCSNELLNRLQENIVRSAKSNFMDIPTDCPQRDERMGWTGDIAVFAPTAAFNFDMNRFLDKWLLDVQAEQLPTGGLPNTVPVQGYGFPATMPKMAVAWWGDACVLVPWAQYMARGDVGVLRRMYELGVRMMTLTWNHENELASPNVVPGGGHNIWPCAPNTETGLKEKGFEFLAEMERLHIIADVSHLSDKGFWDIVEHSTRPFAASHSNCRALAPHCRNLTDEMIRALANKGGLVGLNYCSGFLDNQPEEKLCRSTTALMAKHAAHFKQVGGIEIIGLGSDFDGIGGKLEMDDCSKLPLLADALCREGFTEDEVEAIFYRNARRFFEENL